MMGKWFKHFMKNTLASAAVEFALVLPLLVLILSSTFELTMYALLQNKLQRLAGVMADTVSRKNITRTKLQGFLSQSAQFITPFNFANAKFTMSQIRNEGETDNAVNMLISWQESFQGNASQLGAEGGYSAPLPNNLAILGAQALIVAEISYPYRSAVFSSIIGDKDLYVIYMTTPRGDSMNTLLGG